jgi:hypothetical protein
MANITGASKGFFNDFWDALAGELKTVGGVLAEFFGSVSVTVDDVEAIIADWQSIKANFEKEVNKIKNFSVQPHLKSRVINVPIAIDQIHLFVDDLRSFFTDKLDSIVEPMKELVEEIKADRLASQSTIDKPSAFAVAATISRGVSTSIHKIRNELDAIKDLLELANKLTDAIEKLEPLFLQQKNPRKVVDGFRLRVGKLHESL